jgi:hypothetical protein
MITCINLLQTIKQQTLNLINLLLDSMKYLKKN